MSGPQAQTEDQISVVKPFGASKPAHPAVEIRYSTGPGPVATTKVFHTGLTKRELFAAMAMQRLTGWPYQRGDAEHAADIAVEYADALLKRLAK